VTTKLWSADVFINDTLEVGSAKVILSSFVVFEGMIHRFSTTSSTSSSKVPKSNPYLFEHSKYIIGEKSDMFRWEVSYSYYHHTFISLF